jgi:hypothetical protein
MVKASDLIKEQEKKQKLKKKIYKKVFNMVEKKIKLASYHNMYYVYYELPQVILLEPQYNLDECKNYIIHKLKKNGFKIKEIDDKKILIGWFS